MLTPTQQETTALLYLSIQKAVQYNQALLSDPDLPSEVKRQIYHPIQNKLNYLSTGLNLKIPPAKKKEIEKYFEDPLLYDNVMACLLSMTPEQRDKVEDFINSME